jgi:hypothetical protein
VIVKWGSPLKFHGDSDNLANGDPQRITIEWDQVESAVDVANRVANASLAGDPDAAAREMGFEPQPGDRPGAAPTDPRRS